MKPITIPNKLPITKISADSWDTYELDKETTWVRELLDELNENATYRTAEMYFNASFLDIKLEIKKKFRPSMGEIALVKCVLKTEYFTQCVKTLNEMKDHLELEFQAAFIHSNYEKTPEYEECTEIFEENEVYELYFHIEGNVLLSDMIHEQVYLHYNQYPSTEKDENDEGDSSNLQ